MNKRKRRRRKKKTMRMKKRLQSLHEGYAKVLLPKKDKCSKAMDYKNVIKSITLKIIYF